MKIAINGCHGGFSLSPEALVYIANKQGEPIYFFRWVYDEKRYVPISTNEAEAYWLDAKIFKIPNPNEVDINDLYKYTWCNRPKSNNLDRTDPLLIEAIEVLKERANGAFACLKIVEVPDDVKWHIAEYDGWEWVAEDHRKWE